MAVPKDHIAVVHGNLTVNVPKSLFKEDGSPADDERTGDFCIMLRNRYPWLSGNAADVLMKNAKTTFIRMMDEETCGRSTAKCMISESRYDEAIYHLRTHLSRDPDNIGTLYLLGDILCKTGRAEEGYAVLNNARKKASR